MYSYEAGREITGDESAIEFLSLLLNLVRSSGHDVARADIEAVISSGHTTVNQVLAHFDAIKRRRK